MVHDVVALVAPSPMFSHFLVHLRQAAPKLYLTGALEGWRQLKAWESPGSVRSRYLSVCRRVIILGGGGCHTLT